MSFRHRLPMPGFDFFGVIHFRPWPRVYAPHSFSIIASSIHAGPYTFWYSQVQFDVIYQVAFRNLPNRLHCEALIDYFYQHPSVHLLQSLTTDSYIRPRAHVVIQYKATAIAYFP